MNLLSEHIEYLVRVNDCVIVPGWGALVAQYQAAMLDEATGMLMPPSRSLSFNPSLVHNDGLIAASIARRDKISYDKAVAIVNDEVNALRHQVEDCGEIAIGKLGVFRRNMGGTTIFEPFTLTALSSEFRALKTLNIVPLLTQARLDAGLTAEGEQPRKKDVVYVPLSRNFFKVAASVAVFLGLGFVFSTPMIVDDATAYASLSVPEIKVPVATQLMVEVVDINQTTQQPIVAEISTEEEIKSNPASTATITPIAKSEIATAVEPATIRFDENDHYCLVVASLTTMADAEKYVAQNSNHCRLGILEKDGRYRIYAATGESASQALKAKDNEVISARYEGAWVCRR